MIMSRNLGQIGSGRKQAAAAFADLGVQVLDSHPAYVRSMAEILPLVAERLALASDHPKTAVAVAIMGRRHDPAGVERIPRGLKAVEDQAASLGLVISDKEHWSQECSSRNGAAESRIGFLHIDKDAASLSSSILP